MVTSSSYFLRNKNGKQVKLTDRQYEVLELLAYPNNLTQKQVSIRLKCSRNNITNIVKVLKKKGVYGKTFNLLEGKSKQLHKSNVSRERLFRFHGMRWTIKILHKYSSFKGNESIELDGHKIKVWDKVIEIYSTCDFFGNTPRDAFYNAMKYWDSFFLKLQTRINVELVKEGYCNKQLTKCELADTNNELARDCIENVGDKIVIRGSDGIAWATIDNSHGFFEFETIYSKTALPDMERIQKVMNEYRKEDILTPQEMQDKLSQMIEIQNTANVQIMALTKIMEKYLNK